MFSPTITRCWVGPALTDAGYRRWPGLWTATAAESTLALRSHSYGRTLEDAEYVEEREWRRGTYCDTPACVAIPGIGAFYACFTSSAHITSAQVCKEG